MMSKKILYSIVLITLIAIALFTWSYQTYLHNQADQLQVQNRNLEGEIAHYESQTTDLQNQISQLQTQNNELGSQVRDYESQTADLQNQVSQCQVEVNNLQTQMNNFSSILQNRTNKAVITSFYTTTWFPIVGMTYTKDFYITVCNVGINNVSGLTLNLKYEGNDTNLIFFDPIPGTYQGSDHFSPEQLDILHVGESETIREFTLADLNYVGQLSSYQLVATLVLDGLVLDEKELTIGKNWA